VTAWPTLYARLLVRLPQLTGWSAVQVFDGPPVTGDVPTDYCTVGFVIREDFAGSFDTEIGPGDLTVESGTIRSEIVCSTGDVDLPTVRGRAFALADAWRAETVANPTWGVLNQGSATSIAIDVEPAQTSAGSVQRLTVTLSYTALV